MQDDHTPTTMIHEGVLYKRRDVFRNRWRPRYFMLDMNLGVLTYYVPEDGISPHHSQQQQQQQQQEQQQRFDVVPRGTIYVRDCQVDTDPKHTKESEQFYAFTILPPSMNDDNPPVCFLAAKSQEERTKWIQTISQAASGGGTSVASLISHPEQQQQQQQPSPPQGRDDAEPIPSQQQEGTALDDSNNALENGGWIDCLDDNEELQNTVLKNIPPPLASRIQEKIQTMLPYVAHHDADKHGWSSLMDDKDVTAYSRQHCSNNDTLTTTMMKTTSVMPYPPIHIFNCLSHPINRSKLETNIRITERIQVYNPHTFVDYYAYPPVWPTTARDFVAVGHWRLLQKRTNDGNGNGAEDTQQQQQQKAICIIGFSYSDDELQQLRPNPLPNHVRGNLIVTMYLLEDVPKNVSPSFCRLTRILSFDLSGSVPSKLTKAIVEQQARIPRTLLQFLQQQQQSPSLFEHVALTNSAIRKEIVGKFPSPASNNNNNNNTSSSSSSSTGSNNKSNPRQQEYSERSGMSVVMEPTTSTDQESSLSVFDDDDTDYDSSHPIKSRLEKLFLQVVWLLLPLILWQTMDRMSIAGKEVMFVVAAFLAVRTVVLEYRLGRQYVTGRGADLIGYTTCRFVVDLKGVLRFMANKKEEQKENKSSDDGINNNNDEKEAAEISVVHIVIKAMAQAMSEFEVLSTQKVSIPMLGIDGYYFPRKKKKQIDVSLFASSSSSVQGNESFSAQDDDIVTLNNATFKSIQDIANTLESYTTSKAGKSESTSPNNDTKRILSGMWHCFSSLWRSCPTKWSSSSSLGNCVVFVTPDSDHCEVDMDVVPPPQRGYDFDEHKKITVTVVVGGVRLIKDKRRSASVRSPPKPVISMALTIDCPACNITTSRRFAERVQKLVQFPEMCED